MEPSSVEMLEVAFTLAVAALDFVAAGFLAVTRPNPRPKRWLTAALAAMGAAHLFAAMGYLGRVGGGDPRAWLAGVRDFQMLMYLAFAAFLATYPSPVRWRSWGGAATALVGVLAALSLGLWLVARDALLTLPYGTPGSARNVLEFLLVVGIAAALPFAVLAASRRGAALGGDREREADTLLPMLFSYHLAVTGATGVLALAGLDPLPPRALPGDCCGLTAALTWVTNGAWLGLAGWLAWRKGRPGAAALVAIGAGVTAVQTAVGFGVDLGSAMTVFAALAPFHVVSRYGAFGTLAVPRAVGYAVAGLVLVAVFLMVNAIAVLAFGPSPVGPGAAVILALVAGLAAAAPVLPDRLGLGGGGDGARASADRRLGPYRAALQAELAEGLEGDRLARKLARLRAELGVSEQEHAALEYALRAAAGPAPAAASGGLGPGTLFLGRYRVLRDLGGGGGGTTHLCRDELVGRDVVLKAIRSPLRTAAGLDQVLGEARAIGALQHPNVLTLHDVQQVGDEVFIVMEHATGGSLAARLAGPGGRGATGLSREEFRQLAEGVLRGLEAVHAAGIVHRDVKPSNVLLAGDGTPKLADFGVAHIRGFETTAGPGSAGDASGTVRYMSPEQAKGRQATPRSDLFSAAATLYEALAGQPYLEVRPGESAIEVQLRAARGRPFDRPLEGPPALRAWFARALDPAPERRFGSAAEMRAALAPALSARGTAARSARRR